MSQLRNTKKLEIKNAITKSGYFTIDDFEINFNSKNDYLVVITFIAYPYFNFIMLENEVKDNTKNMLAIRTMKYKTKKVIQTRECPGDYKENETKNYENVDDCIYRIAKWIQNLYDDLQNIDIAKEENNDTKNMKEELDKYFNDTEKFSSNEVTKLNNLLDKLTTRVTELENNLEISKDEANNLIRIVKNGKNNLELMPKKTWFLTTWNKLKSIDKNIKTILEFKDTLFNFIEYANKLLN